MQDDMYDSRRLRVERGPDIRLDRDAPLLPPIAVASLGGQSEDGAERTPLALALTIDPDALPGLREAFERHHSGTQIDVVSQWRTAVPDNVAHSPIALLYLSFPEFDVTFLVPLEVDEYRRSLAAAARTGQVILLEPALQRALLAIDPEDAFREHLSIGLTVANVYPLQLILSQRFDLPFVEQRELARVVEPGAAGPELERFLEGSTAPEQLSMYTTPGVWPLIVVLDPSAADVLVEARTAQKRSANWASLRAGPIAFARLDLFVDERRIAAWIVGPPPAELIRTTSSGPHNIMVVTEALPEAFESAVELIDSAPLFPVELAPDAMRGLLGWISVPPA